MSITNGWTGGQYSLFRAIFGAYLFVHFVQLAPWGAELFGNRGVIPDSSSSPLIHLFPNVLALWDSPAFVTGLLIFAALLSVVFTVGFYDRAAAIGVWYVWACIFGRNPLISNPGLPYVGLLLLAHACLPRAPYGSWERRGDPDPGTGWRMPGSIYAVVWILMALGYTYSGYTKLVSPSWVDGTAMARVLANPLARPGALNEAVLAMPDIFLKLVTWGGLALELAFAPLALWRRTRPFVWLAMLGMHLGLITLIDFADLSLGMVMLHLFTFDPGWVRPLRAGVTEMIFYDGNCGLCHRAIRFVLAEDRTGKAFRFAPLDSDSFRAAVPEEVRAGLPNSVIVRDARGNLLSRSAGVIHVMRRLGGVWRLLAAVMSVIPSGLRDIVYDFIAGIRYRLFSAPKEACPIMPKHLRERFDY